ncbi:MAG: T9SS type A sorting domain-containing protein [Bacteroidota bacterium]
MKKPFISFILFFSAISSFSQPDTLTCNVYGNADTGPGYNGTNYYINSELQDYSGCGATYPAIHVAIIDTNTCEAWGTYNCPNTDWSCTCVMVNPNNQFGNLNNGCGSCRARVEKYFIYQLDPSNPQQFYALDSLLSNDTLGGVYFLVYTWLYADRDAIMSVDPGIYTALANLGASTALTQADSVPFIFFAKEGDPSSAMEVIGTHPEDTISLQALICNQSSVNINTQYRQFSINIFPNPSDGKSFIEYSSEENLEVLVHDLFGRKIRAISLPPGIHQKSNMDFTQLSNGIYSVLVINNGKIYDSPKMMIIK